MHRPCTVGAVGRTDAANLNGVGRLLKQLLHGHRLCTISAVGWIHAANVEWRLAFAKAIVAWCIDPAPSVQLGGQISRMLNGV
jgi:hypothetical protein